MSEEEFPQRSYAHVAVTFLPGSTHVSRPACFLLLYRITFQRRCALETQVLSILNRIVFTVRLPQKIFQIPTFTPAPVTACLQL
jgi:hypothetical protein